MRKSVAHVLVACAAVFAVATTAETSPLILAGVQVGLGTVLQSNGTTTSTFASSPTVNNTRGVAIGADGDLYVVGASSNNVVRFDGKTGALVGTFIASNLNAPRGIALGDDGLWYVSNGGNGTIARFNAAGAFVDVFASGLSTPHEMTFGPDGALYVSNSLANNIQRCTAAGCTTFASGNGLLDSRGLDFYNGSLYVSSRGSNAVLRFDAVTGAFIASVASVQAPYGLMVASDGLLYVAETFMGPTGPTGDVRRFNATTGAFIDTYIASAAFLGPPSDLAEAAVPEPSSLRLVAIGLVAARARRSRRRSELKGGTARASCDQARLISVGAPIL